MTRTDAISQLLRHADAIKAMGATSLYLFGSTARNEAAPDSDLDLFLEYESREPFLVDRSCRHQALSRGDARDRGGRDDARQPSSDAEGQDRALGGADLLMPTRIDAALAEMLSELIAIEAIRAN